MSKAITLPSGATVTLRDPKSLRQKDRTKVYQAASNAEGIMQGVSMIDGLIAVLVESWSFDLIIPSVHLPSLGELEIPDYDALAEEAGKAQDIIFGTGFQETPANESNLDSPLDKSNA